MFIERDLQKRLTKNVTTKGLTKMVNKKGFAKKTIIKND